MKLRKYGITLERLREKDIEQVRYYRNHPKIKKYMHFRGYISKKMQQEWFKSIDNSFNYYFIIHFEGKKIGLINCRDIDKPEVISESGLFIWDSKYIDSPAPLLASLILGEFGFGFMKGEKNSIRVLSSNKKAIDFNRLIGYEPFGEPNADGLQFFIQTRNQFINKTRKLRKLALKLYNSDPKLYLYVEPWDIGSSIEIRFREFMREHNYNFIKTIEGDTEIYAFMFDF